MRFTEALEYQNFTLKPSGIYVSNHHPQSPFLSSPLNLKMGAHICAHWNSFPRVSLAVLSGCVRLVWPKEGMCSLKPFSQEVEGLILATPIHPCRAHPACPASGYMTWSLDHLGNTGAMQMTPWFLGNITAQIKRRHLWDSNLWHFRCIIFVHNVS